MSRFYGSQLMFLASFVPEILGVPDSKSGSRDAHIKSFDLILHHFVSNHCHASLCQI